MSSGPTGPQEFRILLLNQIFRRKYSNKIWEIVSSQEFRDFVNPLRTPYWNKARYDLVLEIITTSLGEELRDLLRSTPEEIQEYVRNNTHHIIEELCSPTFQ